jgi:hypothetical protein
VAHHGEEIAFRATRLVCLLFRQLELLTGVSMDAQLRAQQRESGSSDQQSSTQQRRRSQYSRARLHNRE